jgi:hypothetical protein
MVAVRGGNLIAAGGIVPHWPGRGEAWALVSSTAEPRDLAPAIRLARAWLDQRQRNPMFNRLEAYVRNGAPWRASFMRGLGFEPEGLLTAWGPDGSDFAIYARVVGGLH